MVCATKSATGPETRAHAGEALHVCARRLGPNPLTDEGLVITSNIIGSCSSLNSLQCVKHRSYYPGYGPTG